MNILTVSGDPFECGEQIGSQLKDLITQFIDETKKSPPDHYGNWLEVVEAAHPYLKATEVEFPLVIEELQGVAQGAGLVFEDIFATTVEELWSSISHGPTKACTDIIITPPRVNSVLIGHNNDLPHSFANKMIPVLREFDDGSSLFSVGPCGFYVSVGVNSDGIALTGNELSPTDNKIGVPRSLVARAILTAKTLDEAFKIASTPNRASSYNNIICDKQNVIDFEGSATNFDLLKPENNILVHSNDYVSPKMLQYEAEPNYTSSIERRVRLIKQAQQITGTFTPETLKQLLQSHAPDNTGNDCTVCRHGSDSETVFGIIIDMGTGKVELAMGNPCTNRFEEAWQIPHRAGGE